MTTKKKIRIKHKNSDYRLATKSNEETRALLEKLTGGKLTLGKAIRSIRQCDEISQGDFAKKLGVTQTYLCDLENNRKEVSAAKAAHFARILGHLETQFVRLALQDMFDRHSLHFTIEVRKAA